MVLGVWVPALALRARPGRQRKKRARSNVGLLILSTVSPRASGDPGVKRTDGKTGSPLSWGRTKRGQSPRTPGHARIIFSPVARMSAATCGIKAPDIVSVTRATNVRLFNCETAMRSHPQVWSGLGFARLFSRSPKVRGCGAPEQTPRRKTRLSSAPPAFPAFAFHGARTRTSPVVAGGVVPGSARGCSCEPHPQVPVPAPPSRRLMKAPLDGRDVYDLG